MRAIQSYTSDRLENQRISNELQLFWTIVRGLQPLIELPCEEPRTLLQADRIIRMSTFRAKSNHRWRQSLLRKLHIHRPFSLHFRLRRKTRRSIIEVATIFYQEVRRVRLELSRYAYLGALRAAYCWPAILERRRSQYQYRRRWPATIYSPRSSHDIPLGSKQELTQSEPTTLCVCLVQAMAWRLRQAGALAAIQASCEHR